MEIQWEGTAGSSSESDYFDGVDEELVDFLRLVNSGALISALKSVEEPTAIGVSEPTIPQVSVERADAGLFRLLDRPMDRRNKLKLSQVLLFRKTFDKKQSISMFTLLVMLNCYRTITALIDIYGGDVIADKWDYFSALMSFSKERTNLNFPTTLNRDLSILDLLCGHSATVAGQYTISHWAKFVNVVTKYPNGIDVSPFLPDSKVLGAFPITVNVEMMKGPGITTIPDGYFLLLRQYESLRQFTETQEQKFTTHQGVQTPIPKIRPSLTLAAIGFDSRRWEALDAKDRPSPYFILDAFGYKEYDEYTPAVQNKIWESVISLYPTISLVGAPGTFNLLLTNYELRTIVDNTVKECETAEEFVKILDQQISQSMQKLKAMAIKNTPKDEINFARLTHHVLNHVFGSFLLVPTRWSIRAHKDEWKTQIETSAPGLIPTFCVRRVFSQKFGHAHEFWKIKNVIMQLFAIFSNVLPLEFTRRCADVFAVNHEAFTEVSDFSFLCVDKPRATVYMNAFTKSRSLASRSLRYVESPIPCVFTGQTGLIHASPINLRYVVTLLKYFKIRVEAQTVNIQDLIEKALVDQEIAKCALDYCTNVVVFPSSPREFKRATFRTPIRPKPNLIVATPEKLELLRLWKIQKQELDIKVDTVNLHKVMMPFPKRAFIEKFGGKLVNPATGLQVTIEEAEELQRKHDNKDEEVVLVEEEAEQEPESAMEIGDKVKTSVDVNVSVETTKIVDSKQTRAKWEEFDDNDDHYVMPSRSTTPSVARLVVVSPEERDPVETTRQKLEKVKLSHEHDREANSGWVCVIL